MRTDPAPRAPGDPFEEQLRNALRLEVQRSAFPLDAARLHAAAADPRRRQRLPRGPLPRWWPLPPALAVVASLVLVLVLVGAGRAPGPSPSDGIGGTAGVADGTSAPAAGRATADPSAPISLADCRIEPAHTGLAFSGWATTRALGVTGGSAAPGQPVYALVTSGPAEWTGWRDTGTDPIFPPPVGRMGCIYDPSTGAVSQVGVTMDWQPPAMVDGCPASPQDDFAGYREIGGPRAWALLPTGTSWWISDSRFLTLVRIDPAPAAGESLTAWAQPLEGGSRVPARFQSVEVSVPSVGPQGTPVAAVPRYYVVQARFAAAGCWVLNLAINGRVVGSAIVPVLAVPAAPPATQPPSASGIQPGEAGRPVR